MDNDDVSALSTGLSAKAVTTAGIPRSTNRADLRALVSEHKFLSVNIPDGDE